MPRPPYNVLFLCTGNSARSILAEALLNHLPVSQRKFVGNSAGSFPKGEPNPYALELLLRSGIPIDGLRSKSWDEFARPGAPVLDFIFTVCDQAASEQCPLWPGRPVTAHWGMPDPAAVEGPPEVIRQAFADTFVALRRRIELFANLPQTELERLTMRPRTREAGTR
jgi:arsenate reductase